MFASSARLVASTLQTIAILIGLGLISLLLFAVVAYSVVRFWIVGSGPAAVAGREFAAGEAPRPWQVMA